MANRTMQQKTLKMKRQRRAWSRQYRGKGGFVPNREVIQGYKLHAKGLADKDFIDSIADQLTPWLDKQKLQKQALLELGLPDGCEQRIAGPTGVDQLQESWIYFTTRRDCFVLVHRDLDIGIERTSTTFSSIELLQMCWERGAIPWVQKKSIEP